MTQEDRRTSRIPWSCACPLAAACSSSEETSGLLDESRLEGVFRLRPSPPKLTFSWRMTSFQDSARRSLVFLRTDGVDLLPLLHPSTGSFCCSWESRWVQQGITPWPGDMLQCSSHPLTLTIPLRRWAKHNGLEWIHEYEAYLLFEYSLPCMRANNAKVLLNK